jgi:hypothetical protein
MSISRPMSISISVAIVMCDKPVALLELQVASGRRCSDSC